MPLWFISRHILLGLNSLFTQNIWNVIVGNPHLSMRIFVLGLPQELLTTFVQGRFLGLR